MRGLLGRWAQVVSLALGLWLIVAPEVLPLGGAALTNSRIAGPIVVTFAVLALRDVTRSARFVVIVPALWLLATPLAFHYTQPAAILDNVLVGLALIALAFVRGTIREQTGGGWRSLTRAVIAEVTDRADNPPAPKNPAPKNPAPKNPAPKNPARAS